MTLKEELSAANLKGATALTIGVFDGVHLGHQHLFSLVKNTAARLGGLSGVITFRNHPQEVLQPGFKLGYLTTLDQRLRLMQDSGLEVVCPITFTSEVRNLSPQQFMTLLKDSLGMAALVCGPDFALGRDRVGTATVLAELGRQIGYEVVVSDPFTLDGQIVSSTRIRQALQNGDVLTAQRLLGRTYAITGQVVRGKGRGADLGFPTANVSYTADLFLPASGIYAAWAVLDGHRHRAAVSIGMNPTFSDVRQTSLEAFILDFHQNIYGKTLTLEPAQRLRDERKFDTTDALKRQMTADVEQVRAVLR